MATWVHFDPIVAVQSKLEDSFTSSQSCGVLQCQLRRGSPPAGSTPSPSASAALGQTTCASLTQRRTQLLLDVQPLQQAQCWDRPPVQSLQSPSDGHSSSWTYNFYGMHSNRIKCVPLQQMVEPPPKLGHAEVLGHLGRGLLSPSVGTACSNSLLADTKHLHVLGEGKQLVVCNSKPMVSQSQARVSVIVLNPQRKACVAPQTFSPVESEINSVGHGAKTPHINLVEDDAVVSVVAGGVNDWYTSKPGHAVCKPCSTDTFKPHRARGLPPPQGTDHSLEPLINTVNKSRPSDVRSCLQSVESGIQTGHGQGRDSLAAQIPQVAPTKSSFIDLNNVSNSHGLKSNQTGLQNHTQLQVIKSELDSEPASSHPSLQVQNVLTNHTHHNGGNIGIVVKSCHIVPSKRRSLQADSPVAILRSKPRKSKSEQSADSLRDLAYLHNFLPDKSGRDIGISRKGNLVRNTRCTRKYAKKSTVNPPNSLPLIFRYGDQYYSSKSKLSEHTLSGSAVRSSSNFNAFFSRSGIELPLPVDVNSFNEVSKQEGEESIIAKNRPLNLTGAEERRKRSSEAGLK